MEPEQPEPLEKRRKIRKGTHSCWECKRRKVRCTYASPAHAVCIGCTRRCTECVGQDLPERTAPPAARSRLVGDRIVRVEAMIERLAQQSGRWSPSDHKHHGEQDRNGVLTPMSCDTPAIHSASSYSPSVDDPEGCFSPAAECARDSLSAKTVADGDHRHHPLSNTLLAVYPPQHEVDLLLKMAGGVSAYTLRVLTRSYGEIEDNQTECVKMLKTRPPPGTHPIIIMRHMFMLAIAIQYISPKIPLEGSGLTELPRVTMRRLGDTATSTALINNEMVCAGTVEGLECIILESIYQANSGSLRRAWVTWRRAIAVAQLMDLQHVNPAALKTICPTYVIDPVFIWHRVLFVDRILSLFLGLPQASMDRRMASGPALKTGSAQDQFEQMHSVIASKILERNEHDPGADDFALTQAIDAELRHAASRMPSRWWLTPNWAHARNDSELFWEITRLQSQIVHYNLLNLLHLPYILHSSSDPEHRRYDYSRITCVNAARDVLKSYILFRSFNRIAYCCRVVDFFAFTASLTLLLAHLNSHNTCKHPTDNVFAHQRLSDRAMMEQALETMDVVGDFNEDALSMKSARLLRQLLKIEADAALGSRHKLGKVKGNVRDAEGVLRVEVPYMGSIIIEREGDSGEELQDQRDLSIISGPQTMTPNQNLALISDSPRADNVKVLTTGRGRTTTTDDDAGASQAQPTALSGQNSSVTLGPQSLHEPNVVDTDQFTNASFGTLDNYDPTQFPTPGLTAGVDEWAFQGVDMAFFNRLMRGVDVPLDNENDSW